MKVTDLVETKIERLPKGHVFTFSDVSSGQEGKEAVIKALNRMVRVGKLEKLAKGKFYKPEATVFGKLQPELRQVVKDLLEREGKVIGYLTGLSIYSQLGLTTQISNVIQIGKNDIRPKVNRGRYTISFIQQKNPITQDNIPLLQILDAIRYIKKIPDTSVTSAFKRISSIIDSLSFADKQKAMKLALKYPPSTRAALGAILDTTQNRIDTSSLRKTLNPITSYTLGIAEEWPVAKKWNIT
ncbi:DUF6088 family protein [Algoriphagus resistens]|uniref:DUF6088 family protein n=1 Tax=Algoriphagus resistens TaxID=1750590 RepID=UPI0007169844|nr:DUF6088 family protein [Algoriphagus resistens]